MNVPHVFVRKSYPVIKFYDDGWSSVDNPYGPGGYAYDGPPIEEEPPKPRRLRQSTLPEFDPMLDETTGWTGVPPVSAFRVQDDNPAGQPVPQGYANVTFETGSDWNPDSRIQHPPVDDPIYDDDVESEYSRDPVSNVRYRQGRMGQRQFVDLPDAKAGTWVTRPTMGDVKNLYTHNYPEKIVMVRGPIDQYGKVHRRDSDKAVENLAEAFIEHDDPIPPERLVTIPLSGRTYLQAADDLGLPQTYNTRGGKTSRWSDALPPFRTPQTEEEMLREIQDEYKQTGEPMEIAFQLLKAHTLPKGQYSPKNLFKLISEEKIIDDDEVIPMDIKDHFYDQAVNRGFMDARHHRGKRQQMTRGEGEIFKPEGGYSKYRNPADYVKALAQVFLHEHGINHPSQIGERGMMLHFGDREGNMFKDKSKQHKGYRDSNIGGYTAVIEPDRANPEGLALVSMYGDSPRALTRDENQMMGKTYSLLDDVPGLGTSYMSEPIGDNGRPVVDYDERRRAAQPPEVAQTRQVIPSMAKDFLNEHFQHEDNQHTNGKRMFSFTGKGAKWAAGKTLPDGWNNDMNRTANVIGSALNQLYNNSELGMSVDDVHALGEDMYSAWRQHYEDKQAMPYHFNSIQLPENTPGAHVVNPDMMHSDMVMAGDPMELAFRLLKERKSPEAMRRKKEYDTKYESSPERVKYREELNRERKRRGIYGSHDHMDVSHTQGGRLTLEGEHANRARHFKNRGTLRRVRVR